MVVVVWGGVGKHVQRFLLPENPLVSWVWRENSQGSKCKTQDLGHFSHRTTLDKSQEVKGLGFAKAVALLVRQGMALSHN